MNVHDLIPWSRGSANQLPTFKNGLLTVTLPKTERVQSNAKRIAINSAS
jgi:hypothetical protein